MFFLFVEQVVKETQAFTMLLVLLTCLMQASIYSILE